MEKAEIERFARNLDWNLLQDFLVIVEEKGVTRAATRLHVSQPAVTNKLQRLEKYMDSHLIDRTAREFTLTETGQMVYEECVELYSNVSRMAETLKDVRDSITGHVSVNTPTHAESKVIDNALWKFHKTHTKATVSLHVATSWDVITSVKRKNAACGIALVTSRTSSLNYDVIYRERFGLYCGYGSELFGRDDVSLDEIAAQPYVTFPTDVIGGELHNFTVARKKSGIDSVPISQSYHLEEIRRLIEIGVGIGPHPVHVAQRFVDQGRLWQLKAFNDYPVFEVCLITNPRIRLNAAEQAFINIIRDEIYNTPLEERTVEACVYNP
ncbi:LysR family transcriptional regulator, partial [Reinekea blandensis]